MERFSNSPPRGKLTTLHSFDLSDGAYPEAALVLGTDRNFYGTTSSGGTGGDGGTIFQITPRRQVDDALHFLFSAATVQTAPALFPA